MKKIVLAIAAIAFGSTAAYAAADVVKKCCCDDKDKTEHPHKM